MADESGRVTRVLIVSDQAIFRDSLKCLLDSQPGFRVVGEARNDSSALDMVSRLEPEILLLDQSTPQFSCAGVLRALAASGSKARAIVLSAGGGGEQIVEAFQLGARGLVLKESASSLLFKSIRSVMDGLCWIGGESVSDPSQSLSRLTHGAGGGGAPKDFGLTTREKEIIHRVVAGFTNKEIAHQFSIHEQTVKHHLTNIFDKLGVYSRLELALFALYHGLVER